MPRPNESPERERDVITKLSKGIDPTTAFKQLARRADDFLDVTGQPRRSRGWGAPDLGVKRGSEADSKGLVGPGKIFGSVQSLGCRLPSNNRPGRTDHSHDRYNNWKPSWRRRVVPNRFSHCRPHSGWLGRQAHCARSTWQAGRVTRTWLLVSGLPCGAQERLPPQSPSLSCRCGSLTRAGKDISQ